VNQPAHKTEGVYRTQTLRFYPFVFTGKEKDEETGYGYFGARYMDHEQMAMWLSVDPMADKYPGISPYNYCMWNPVKLVDPDGREIDDYFTKDGKFLGSDNAETHYVRIIREDCWTSLDKDEHGNALDHDLANELSTAFSDASKTISKASQLAVYQHYNPTGYSLVEKTYDETTSSNPGYSTRFSSTKEGTTLVMYIEIKLKENRTKNSVGNAVCDNADEITSLFIHENDHIQRGLKMSYEDMQKTQNTKELLGKFESNAVNAQRNHSSWNGCRKSFQEGMDRYERSFQ
jgi:RHS repeat-associated protein